MLGFPGRHEFVQVPKKFSRRLEVRIYRAPQVTTVKLIARAVIPPSPTPPRRLVHLRKKKKEKAAALYRRSLPRPADEAARRLWQKESESEGGRELDKLVRKEKEGWIKLDPPVPKELAIATGSSQAIFNNRGTRNPWDATSAGLGARRRLQIQQVPRSRATRLPPSPPLPSPHRRRSLLPFTRTCASSSICSSATMNNSK
ncbi:hypothetical protein OJAV_G00206050 [Oryzias javanicus]|uniref:Uncharacterized protein n=1 Tax=Oryzias javanicus TaxID=123683 RepID=A0A3S2PCW6_ORYJA|nr:hypothetical protein OJAV_G00206050 [Oryzias javanicus]